MGSSESAAADSMAAAAVLWAARAVASGGFSIGLSAASVRAIPSSSVG
jgi:hypothetical protein